MKTIGIGALLFLACVATASADEFRRFELGFGVQGGWSSLQEAGDATDLFTLGEKPGFGPVLGAGWRMSERATLELEIAGGVYESNIPGVEATSASELLTLRYRLLKWGGVRPYLRGSFGGTQTVIASTEGGASLRLDGIAGHFGLGLRLATSPRLQFDLELNHMVVNYDDVAVVLDNIYVGGRIDKAGAVTRLQLVARLLI